MSWKDRAIFVPSPPPLQPSPSGQATNQTPTLTPPPVAAIQPVASSQAAIPVPADPKGWHSRAAWVPAQASTHKKTYDERQAEFIASLSKEELAKINQIANDFVALVQKNLPPDKWPKGAVLANYFSWTNPKMYREVGRILVDHPWKLSEMIAQNKQNIAEERVRMKEKGVNPFGNLASTPKPKESLIESILAAPVRFYRGAKEGAIFSAAKLIALVGYKLGAFSKESVQEMARRWDRRNYGSQGAQGGIAEGAGNMIGSFANPLFVLSFQTAGAALKLSGVTPFMEQYVAQKLAKQLISKGISSTIAKGIAKDATKMASSSLEGSVALGGLGAAEGAANAPAGHELAGAIKGGATGAVTGLAAGPLFYAGGKALQTLSRQLLRFITQSDFQVIKSKELTIRSILGSMPDDELPRFAEKVKSADMSSRAKGRVQEILREEQATRIRENAPPIRQPTTSPSATSAQESTHGKPQNAIESIPGNPQGQGGREGLRQIDRQATVQEAADAQNGGPATPGGGTQHPRPQEVAAPPVVPVDTIPANAPTIPLAGDQVPGVSQHVPNTQAQDAAAFAASRDAGVVLDGEQKAPSGNLMLFTDPQTGTTFSVKSDNVSADSVIQARDSSRETFRNPPKPSGDELTPPASRRPAEVRASTDATKTSGVDGNATPNTAAQAGTIQGLEDAAMRRIKESAPPVQDTATMADNLDAILKTGKWSEEHIGQAAEWLGNTGGEKIRSFVDAAKALFLRFGKAVQRFASAVWRKFKEIHTDESGNFDPAFRGKKEKTTASIADLSIITGARAIRENIKTPGGVAEIVKAVTKQLEVPVTVEQAQRIKTEALRLVRRSMAGELAPDDPIVAQRFEKFASSLRESVPSTGSTTIKQQIRKATGAETSTEKTASEGEALKASLKRQEKTSREAFKQGYQEAKGKYKANQISQAQYRDELAAEVVTRLPKEVRGEFIKRLTKGNLSEQDISNIEAGIENAFNKQTKRQAVSRYNKVSASLDPVHMTVADKESLSNIFKDAGIEGGIGGIDPKGLTLGTREKLTELDQFFSDHPDIDIPDGMFKKLARLDQVPIDSMTADQVDVLTNTIKQFKTVLKNRNRLIMLKDNLTLAQNGRNGAKEIKQNVKEKDSTLGTPQRPNIAKLVLFNAQAGLDTLTTLLGGGDRSSVNRKVFYENLLAGNRLELELQRELSVQHQGIKDDLKIKNRGIDKWRRELKPYVINGKTFYLTRSDLQAFYATWQREESRVKMMRNGFKKRETRGLTSDRYMIASNPAEAREAMKAIKGLLTAKEREYVDRSVALNRSILQEPMNNVSLTLDGYEKYTEPVYPFPMEVERTGAVQEMGSGAKEFRSWLDSIGFSKELVQHKHPLLIGDFTGSLIRYWDRATKYAGVAVPVRDSLKLLHNSDYLAALRTHATVDVERRFLESLRHISGMGESASSLVDKIARWIYKSQAVYHMGFSPTTYTNNRIGGAFQLSAELPPEVRARFLKQTVGNLLTLDQISRVLPKRKRDIVSIMEDGYFYDRWVKRPHDQLVVTYLRGKNNLQETVTHLGAAWNKTMRGVKGLANYSMSLHGWAEMMNVVDAYRALQEVGGYSKDEILNILERATRRSQNPTTAMEKTPFTRTTQKNPLVALFVPFQSQNNVTYNQILTQVLEGKDTKTLGATVGGRQVVRLVGLAGRLTSILIGATIVSQIGHRVWNKFRGVSYPNDDKGALALDVTTDIANTAVPGSELVIGPILRKSFGYRPFGSGSLADDSVKTVGDTIQYFRIAATAQTEIERRKNLERGIASTIKAVGQFGMLPTKIPAQVIQGVYNFIHPTTFGRLIRAQSKENVALAKSYKQSGRVGTRDEQLLWRTLRSTVVGMNAANAVGEWDHAEQAAKQIWKLLKANRYRAAYRTALLFSIQMKKKKARMSK